MAAKRDDSTAADQLVDLLVYAPVGIALEAVDNLPKFIERGKSQVTLGRFVARAAARKGTSTIESVGERVVQEAGQVIVDLFGIDLSADEGEDEPVVAPRPEPADDTTLPIANYDSQAAAQIVKLLGQLTPQERETIAEHERSGRNRVTILRKIEQLRDNG
ncbi:MAG: hypothetical protein R8J94_17740 [Acidimicrobiia bacterium]|nr:hypothetical protein [Acidimicrobiia bacterium]